MGALRDLVDLVRWSRAQPWPSVAEALGSAAGATRDLQAYQDATARGVVDVHNGVPATAVVAEVRPLPPGPDATPRAELVLVVHVPGQAPVRTARVERAPRPVAVGDHLPVLALRLDPTRFTIDWG